MTCAVRSGYFSVTLTVETTYLSVFYRTFRTGGFVIKSSNGSSGLTVVRFSCKIPIFFSLSHPDGLKKNKTKKRTLFMCSSFMANYLKEHLNRDENLKFCVTQKKW